MEHTPGPDTTNTTQDKINELLKIIESFERILFFSYYERTTKKDNINIINSYKIIINAYKRKIKSLLNEIEGAGEQVIIKNKNLLWFININN